MTGLDSRNTLERHASRSSNFVIFLLSLGEEEKYSNETISNLTSVCTHNFRACCCGILQRSTDSFLFVGIIFIFTVKREKTAFFFSIKHEKFDFDPTQIKEVMQFFRNSIINKETIQVENSLESKFDAVIQILTALYYLLVNSSQSRLMLHD